MSAIQQAYEKAIQAEKNFKAGIDYLATSRPGPETQTVIHRTRLALSQYIAALHELSEIAEAQPAKAARYVH